MKSPIAMCSPEVYDIIVYHDPAVMIIHVPNDSNPIKGTFYGSMIIQFYNGCSRGSLEKLRWYKNKPSLTIIYFVIYGEKATR